MDFIILGLIIIIYQYYEEFILVKHLFEAIITFTFIMINYNYLYDKNQLFH